MPSDGLPKNLEPLAAGDPATIGPYMLAGRLGSGGMGTVYLGRTPDRGALVAIKVIRPELAFDEQTRARFRDEMQNAQRVASFCTAKILDHGTFENRPYMVTEYIAGTALAEHIAKHGALDSSTLHGFALGVAAALQAIHGAGLVHRDLKPANVILSLSGPRVIDFGIARALNTATNHTQTGIVMGSPGWMAPEQLLEEKVTTAADIFAWGCLVAFAGNGTHPFGNGDAMTLGKRVLFAEPQIGNLDSPLDRLVRAALTKEPEQRPTARDLMLELAGGNTDSGEAKDPNDMVSHALHQSWRPNLPPMPPGPTPGPHQTATGMPLPNQPAPHPGPPPQPYGPQSPPQNPAAKQSQPMRRPGPDSGQGYPGGQRPAHQTGQFATVAPHATGPIPQVPPGPGQQGQGGPRPPAAQPYVPPVPPPPHKPLQPEKRRIRWLVAAVILGLLLVSILFATLVLLSPGGGLPSLPQQGGAEQQDDDAGAGEEDPDDNQRDTPRASEIGTVQDSGVEFTVYEPLCEPQPQGPGSRCEFLVIVRNLSGSNIELNPEWYQLEERRGNTTTWIVAEQPGFDGSNEPLWQPIPADSDAEGTLVFLVQDSTQLERLRLRGTQNSPGEFLPLNDVTA